MIQSRNGQSQSEAKPGGRFTGDRLLRERPRIYRKVVELLAEPGMSINQIIAERKQRLMSIFGNVAEIAAERIEELAGQASLRDAGITAGIATDKLLALSSDSFSQLNNHLHVHLESIDIMGQFNKMLKELPTKALEAKGTAAKALPSGPDKEATQPIATTQPAEGCASEEKPAQKQS